MNLLYWKLLAKIDVTLCVFAIINLLLTAIENIWIGFKLDFRWTRNRTRTIWAWPGLIVLFFELFQIVFIAPIIDNLSILAGRRYFQFLIRKLSLERRFNFVHRYHSIVFGQIFCIVEFNCKHFWSCRVLSVRGSWWGGALIIPIDNKDVGICVLYKKVSKQKFAWWSHLASFF